MTRHPLKVPKSRDPWMAIERLWVRNRGVNPRKVAADVRAAIRAVRRSRAG